ncbi:hypothetical protein SAMN02745127_02108 [Oceanospirillum multiglobuliferum]|uniref:Uncharacterized protein n=1 Tax=Oceanospirillum multiglobuliferum TaxID=64969 RepID=A0A1T4QZV8_9GAMM|nr:hypothetical protein [Oceanospirillum multiglobuliferum]OPX57034.1 hypothetical protein BTE48_00970 [Oceanospirillum multiglobuliferum]SKA09175.1 hypothetical protein SAMN02745127_02108 [Oceanospirillum multiglobuliferum]
MLFLPVQQELNCVSDNGNIVGSIIFEGNQDRYVFYPENESVVLSNLEVACIAERLSGLHSGKYVIPMQDDD